MSCEHPDRMMMRRRPEHHLAIVGCGAIAEGFYLPACAALGLLPQVVLVDPDPHRLAAVTRRFTVGATAASHREVVGRVAGAVVAVPHHLHVPVTLDLLAADIHVLCEKPLAETAEEAGHLVEAARRHGRVLAVNLTRRLFPANEAVRALIAEGALGTLRSIRYLDGNEFSWPAASGFYVSPAGRARGVLLDIGAHVFDLLCWWLNGEPRVESCATDARGGVDAVAAVGLRHAECRCDVRLSRLARYPNTFLVTGDAGWIAGQVYDGSRLEIHSPAGVTRRTYRGADMSSAGRRLLLNFMKVVAGVEPPLVSGADALAAMRVIDVAYAGATCFDMSWYGRESGAAGG